MNPAYASRLGFQIYRTDIRAQKIDGLTLKIFEIVLASFQIEDKFRRIRFFQETFLLADINTEIVLGMLFLILSNANV